MNNYRFRYLRGLRLLFRIRSFARAPLLRASMLIVGIGLLSSPAFAQLMRWHYVITVTGGTKFYLGKDRRTTGVGTVLVWEKTRSPDNAFMISLAEWNCGEKIRRTKQSTFYDSSNTLFGSRGQMEWKPVIPGSSADFLMELACHPVPQPVFAEITVPRAALLGFPDSAAPVKRIAAFGEKFRVVPHTGSDGWYNLVELSGEEEDYWLTGDSLLIKSSVPTSEPSAASAKSKSVTDPVVYSASKKKKRS